MRLDNVPIALSALLLALIAWFRFHLAPFPGGAEALPAFADDFSALLRAERFVVFPLGIAASIATWIVMLRHGAPRSRRGLLQGGAAVLFFVAGVITTLVGEPLAKAVLEQVASGSTDGLAPLLDRWAMGHSIQLAIALAIFGCLVIADRQPIPPGATGASALGPRQRTLLFLLGTATLFEGYDAFIASMALPYIGRDLGASEATLGLALAAIRVGALASMALGRVADRRGRRGLLLVTIVAYTVSTAATGLSRGVADFVLFQFFAQIFLVTELAVAQVVIAEEFPASFRSTGQGMLGAFGALGAGMAALLFPIFQETSLGWRGLYFVGIAPLLLTAYLRRALPETERWQQARASGAIAERRLGELLRGALAARFVALLAIGFAIGASVAPAFAFASYRATNAFGWTPSQVSALVILGGGLGMLGWFVSGWLSERWGRRGVGACALVATTVAAAGYYATAHLAPAFALLVFANAAASVALNALGTELFPTALRSTAKSWISNFGVIGAVAGMVAVGVLGPRLGGSDATILALAAFPVASALLLAWVPETRGLELD